MKYFVRIFIFLISAISLLNLSCKKSDTRTLSPLAIGMFNSLENQYRLHPDSRFLTAVADIHHFFTGQEKLQATAKFQNGLWEISYGDTKVGSVPEFPDFPDFMTALQQFASTLQESHSLHLVSDSINSMTAEIDQSIKSYQPVDIARAANKLGQQWEKGPHLTSLLSQATKTLVTLSVQQYDELGIGESVPSKALAMLALTKALTKHNLVREECLLAYIMGYSQHAENLANTLPSSDVARLYVLNEDEKLLNIATGENAAREAKYFYLLRLVSQGDFESFWKWGEKEFDEEWYSMLMFKAALQLRSFDTSPYLSAALPRVVLINIALEAATMPEIDNASNKIKSLPDSPDKIKFLITFIDAALRSQTSTLMNSFESGIKVLEKQYTGPFLDAKTYQDFYKGYFFSSFYIAGLHNLDWLSSIPSSNEFVAELGRANDGIAADIQQWYKDLTLSKAGKIDVSSLIGDLKNLNHLGGSPLMRTMEEIEKYYSYGAVQMPEIIKLLATRLDSRPSYVSDLGYKAWTHLIDLRMTEKLYRNALRTSAPSNQYNQAWFALFMDDTTRAIQILLSPKISYDQKEDILSLFNAEIILNKNIIENEYRNLVNNHPKDWSANDKYGEFLEKNGKHEDARKVWQKWLDSKAPVSGLENVFTQMAIAKSYFNEKRYDEAWNAIQPAIHSWQGDAMELGSEILDKLGRFKEAEKLAIDVVDRYPDNLQGRTALAAFYWRHEKYNEAAQILGQSLRPLRITDWQSTIAPKFYETFSDLSSDKTIEAYSALLSLNPDLIGVQTICRPFERDNKPDVAFELTSRLRVKDPALQIKFWTYCYKQLKVLNGKKEAEKWLRNKIPQNLLSMASMLFYDEEQFELLWELIDKPEAYSEPDFTWLMRTAAVIRTGAKNNPHWEEILEHYENVDDKNYYGQIGKYLAGLITEEQAIALTTDLKKVCEVSYYIGLLAQSQGRYADASNWYRITIETQLQMNLEYQWAYNNLYKWKNMGESLSKLSPENNNLN